MTGTWTDMFDDPRGPKQNRTETPPPYEPDDVEIPLESLGYRPWTLQRGQIRPPLLLDLRRYEPRSGMWSGWQLSYPTLNAVEYVGDRLLSLDFGARQFVLEGRGLSELARHLQKGTVVSIQEFAPKIWPVFDDGPLVASIRRIEPSPGLADA